MEIALTKRQKAIIVGNILGDGYLEFNGFHGTRLQMKQSQKYKEYILWLYQELKNLCKSEPNKRRDGSQWFFGTRYINDLTKLRKQFYDEDGKKRIPDNISDILTSPLSLAVWYMDDGTLDWRPKDHYAFSLTINCFSLQDAARLSETLSSNFDIESNVQNPLCRGIRYPKLYIGKVGREKFLSLIRPYIVECFNYKLPPL